MPILDNSAHMVGSTIQRAILRHLIGPLVNFCLRRGISSQLFIAECKEVFVRAAAKEFGAEPNLSKIAIRTGFSRQEVTKILREPPTEDKAEIPILVRVLNLWENDERFSFEKKPRHLTFQGADSEFSVLVRAVSSSISPATVLAELERVGCAQKAGNKVEFIRIFMTLCENEEQSYAFAARDMDGILRSIENNVDPEKKDIQCPLYHTEFDNVRPEAIEEIRKFLFREHIESHKRVREILSEHDRDVNPRPGDPGAKGVSVWVGTYALLGDGPKSLK